MPSPSLRRKALQMLLLCTAFWALSFPVMKALNLVQLKTLPHAGSWFISSLCVMLRFLSAGLLMSLFSAKKLGNATRLELEQAIWLAAFASAGLALQMDGLAYIPASTSAFLTQLYCVLIPLWVAVSKSRFPTAKILVCSALVLVGMAVLVNLNLLAIRLGRGELETIASSILFAGQILCLENPRYASNRPQIFTTLMLLAMGLFAIPAVIITAPGWRDCFHAYASTSAIGLLAILVLICSIIPFLLMNRWQREVTATEAGLVYCAEPVLASLSALFLPNLLSQWTGVDYVNEQVTARLLVGGGLITAANALLQSPWLEPKSARQLAIPANSANPIQE